MDLLCSHGVDNVVQFNVCHSEGIFLIGWLSWSPDIMLFDLIPKNSRTVSPNMYCSEIWDFHNKQVISIGGETNS